MNRLVHLAFLLAFGVLFTACPEEKSTKVVAPQMSDADAIIGTWVVGQSVISFNKQGEFTWEMPRPCNEPPCPVKSMRGTYQMKQGQIALSTPDEGDDTVSYKIKWNPRGLWVKSAKYESEWNHALQQ